MIPASKEVFLQKLLGNANITNYAIFVKRFSASMGSKVSKKAVMPARADVRNGTNRLKRLDSRHHGDDLKGKRGTFCELKSGTLFPGHFFP
jgi:hypothetical protein